MVHSRLTERAMTIRWLAAFFYLIPVSLYADSQQVHPLQAADTSSPRATMETFLDSFRDIHDLIQNEKHERRHLPRLESATKRILACLDLEGQPEFVREDYGKKAAVCLKEVFDRIELPPLEEIPGETEEGDEEGEELPIRWRVPPTEITLKQIEEGPRKGEYLFSEDTVENAEDYFLRVESLPYQQRPDVMPRLYDRYLSEPGHPASAAVVRKLPAWSRERLGGQAVWQWLGLTVVVLAGLFAIFLVYRIGRRLDSMVREESPLKYCLTLLFPLAAVLIPLFIGSIADDVLSIRGRPLAITKFVTNVVFLLTLIVLLIGAGNRIAELIISSPKINPRGIDAQFIRMGCRVLSLVAATIVFLEGGQYLGIPLTTLLAGAGVGGLAFALAAQDTLKNLFGSVMIVMDKPYRVGERIAIKRYDGVVEEIGLRSTKIRTLTGHLTTIPNEEMARLDIENIGRRPHIRRIIELPLKLDTPPEKIQEAVDIVREIMANHQGMDPNLPPRVYFSDLDRDALKIRCFYWYHPPEYWEFLQHSQELNVKILRAFAAANIELALPSSNVRLDAQDAQPIPLEMHKSKE